MNYIDISILVICITVILSGFYVNFQRTFDEKEKVKIASDSTLLIFRIAVPLSLIMSIVMYFSRWGSIGFNPTVYLGFGFVIIGLIVRWYSIYTLGRSFQVNVTIMKDQKLVKNGIYSLVRHPSYSGLLLYYLGLGLIMHNYISIGLLIVGPLFAVVVRIRKEESFLEDHFGEAYRKYRMTSHRLIPYIY